MVAKLGRSAQWLTGRRSLSILIYHRVLEAPDPFRPGDIQAPTFDWHMRLLRERFTPLSLAEGLTRLEEGSLPTGAVSVTFDDGYADNLTVALPILQRWSVPATVFVASGFLGDGMMWNDIVTESLRRMVGQTVKLDGVSSDHWVIKDPESAVLASKQIIDASKYLDTAARDRVADSLRCQSKQSLPRLMLAEDDLRSLARSGVEIGGHTVTHPILSRVEDEHAAREIRDCKAQLENIIQQPVLRFAYPNGKPGVDFEAKHSEMVRSAGYSHAVATAWGACRPASDDFQLPRFTPWDRTPARFSARFCHNALRGRP